MANSTTIARFDGGTQNNWISINSDSGKSAGIVYEDADSPKWYVGHYNGNTDGFSFYDASTSAVKVFIKEGGNVGIGQTDPKAELHIGGSFGDAANDLGTAALAIKQTSTSAENGIYIERAAEDKGYYIGISGVDGLTFRRNFSGTKSDIMSLTREGNVGIGTTSPSHKLEVNGSFAATTKSFLIDHPTKENMRLQYGALEGPENGVYVRGKSNYKIIDLPEYWTNLVDEESITVQLTSIGGHQHLYVEKIRNNQVFVNIDKIQQRRLNYYYIVHAERKDVDKLEVEIEK